MKKLLLTMIYFFGLFFASSITASYVSYSVGNGGFNSESNYSVTYFGTGDGSFSYYSGPVFPPIDYNQWVYGLWVAAANGDVPQNALVHHYVNTRPIYSCRSLYNNHLIAGFLVPGEGCYLLINNNTIRTTVYDVLLR